MFSFVFLSSCYTWHTQRANPEATAFHFDKQETSPRWRWGMCTTPTLEIDPVFLRCFLCCLLAYSSPGGKRKWINDWHTHKHARSFHFSVHGWNRFIRFRAVRLGSIFPVRLVENAFWRPSASPAIVLFFDRFSINRKLPGFSAESVLLFRTWSRTAARAHGAWLRNVVEITNWRKKKIIYGPLENRGRCHGSIDLFRVSLRSKFWGAWAGSCRTHCCCCYWHISTAVGHTFGEIFLLRVLVGLGVHCGFFLHFL